MPSTEFASRPVIIEVALNGQTTKDVNPNAPRSAQEIAESSLRCIDRGASLIHTHIDEIMSPGERAAELYLEHFRPILQERPDALVYPTLGFGDGASNASYYPHGGQFSRDGLECKHGIADLRAPTFFEWFVGIGRRAQRSGIQCVY